MLATLRNAWKTPELRRRMIFTFMMLVIFRMGNFIPVPGINTEAIKQSVVSSENLFGFYDMISGGAFSNFSIFAMGVTPYINASIIMQLLTEVLPKLSQLSKEGHDGRQKIQNITRYVALVIGVVEGIGIYALLRSKGAVSASSMSMWIIVLTISTASVFLVWLGEQITTKGIGNGVSLIIMVNILSRIPQSVITMVTSVKTGNTTFMVPLAILAVIMLLLLVVVIVNLSERRVPVQYAGKAAGSKVFKGQSSSIPINMSNSAVLAIIFATSFLQMPYMLAQTWPNHAISKFILTSKFSVFVPKAWIYIITFVILIVLFSVFYTSITFKPDEMSENMHKSSGFIPGIRPGEPTTRYLEGILNKTAVLGGIFASIIAVFPIVVGKYTPFDSLSLGGTALLIVVGVAVETTRQIESQLVMRSYEGFLK
ncbi:protein translocase subunit secY/sec61 alpha [Hathewaya proteolytica DSM 3090]|uniref:Protein translocase subunit SecY n=1 Tax=Hathewaya proteolytica DSM 3090 TaxID=1121331 RepID=A0A1M6SSY6_9CLOT|nr:preprotein translocase subunit SecY [Hathewaya proteolytica]SHK47844.1 protein translocase subunit secY/sec61 alpha [Hathewaya proteolytica DSM 3090]